MDGTSHSSKRPNAAGASIWLCGLALVGGGCAVTTIDVDVYKGPLSNDQDVQTEQTVSMAIGAKPLLVQLRDQLEWGPQMKGPDSNGLSRAQEMRANVYKDGAIPHRSYAFKSDLAKQVNEVLSLYDDLDSEEEGAHSEEAQAAWNRFKADLSVLNTGPDDARFWESARRQLRPDPGTDLLARLRPGGLVVKPAAADAVARAGHELVAAYEHFLSPGAGALRKKEIFIARVRLRSALTDAGVAVPSEILTLPKGLEAIPKSADDVSANLYFRALQDGTVARKDAEILFTEAAPLETQFVQRVSRIATAFLDARSELVQLMQICLHDLESEGKAQGARRQPRVRAAAELAASLVQPFYLWAALNNVTAQDATLHPAITDLRQRLLQQLPATYAELNRWVDTGEDRRRIQDALVRVLMENPVEYAAALREAHLLLINDFKPPAGGNFGPLVEHPIWRLYGIVRGPGPSDAIERVLQIGEGAEAPAESATAWWDVTTWIRGKSADRGRSTNLNIVTEEVEPYVTQLAQTGALAGGRAREGLETLTRTYVEKLSHDPRHNAAAAEERVRLLEELTRFAQKILFVANYEQLLLETKTVKIGEAPNRAQEVIAYTRVLQAVGNSILIQVDELRRHSRWSQDSEEFSGVEAFAQAQAGQYREASPPAAATTQPVGTSSRTRVMDQLIAKLRYERERLIEQGGASDAAARRLGDAVEFLYQERAGGVYIRPPAAYLRNSYPVTSLQQEAKLRWSNMLADEAEHAMPFSEILRDNVIDADAARGARITSSIDKTFWQNINRIRVAGTGRTNYVMVKDDIGNWYVKGYSADPSEIINAMRSTASYAIGAPVDTASIQAAMKGKQAVDAAGTQVVDPRTKEVTDTGGPTPGSSPKKRAQGPKGEGKNQNLKTPEAPASQPPEVAPSSLQEQQVRSARAAYTEALKRANEQLDAGMNSVTQAVSIAWARNQIDPQAFQKAAARAEQTMRKAAPATRPGGDSTELESQVLQKLRAMLAYRESLLAGIYTPADESTRQGAATQAARSAAATQEAESARRDSLAATRSASAATQKASAATRGALDATAPAAAATRAASAAKAESDAGARAADKSNELSTNLSDSASAPKHAPPTKPTTRPVTEALQESATTRNSFTASTRSASGETSIAVVTETRIRRRKMVPAVQPSPSDIAPSGVSSGVASRAGGTGITSAQRRQAFQVAADALRDKLQPLLRNSIAATSIYQAQLQAISAK